MLESHAVVERQNLLSVQVLEEGGAAAGGRAFKGSVPLHVSEAHLGSRAQQRFGAVLVPPPGSVVERGPSEVVHGIRPLGPRPRVVEHLPQRLLLPRGRRQVQRRSPARVPPVRSDPVAQEPVARRYASVHGGPMQRSPPVAVGPRVEHLGTVLGPESAEQLRHIQHPSFSAALEEPLDAPAVPPHHSSEAASEAAGG